MRRILRMVGIEYKVTHADLLIVSFKRDELGTRVNVYNLRKSKISRIFANLIK